MPRQNDIEMALLDPEDASATTIAWPLAFRGRAVGSITIDLRALFDAAVGAGEDPIAAARYISEIPELLEDEYSAANLTRWLEVLYQNGKITHGEILKLLSRWDVGRWALMFPEVQDYLSGLAMKPKDVDAVVDAIARGMRSKVTYFKSEGGRPKAAALPPSAIDAARRTMREIQSAVKAAKRAPSVIKRRAALTAVAERFLPSVPTRDRDELVEAALTERPIVIAGRIAALATGIPNRRIRVR